MDYQPAFEKPSVQAEELFKEATFEEFFGDHLFDTRDQGYYLFPSDERGDAVCLLEKRRSDQEEQYEILRIQEERKFHPNPIAPRTCSFDHCETIPDTWIEDGRAEDIKSRIKQGGKSLGKKLNKAFADVLLAASSRTKMRLQDKGLGETLADVYSDLVNDGFYPDVFLFPKHLEAKLVQQGIIDRDREIQNTHYIGTTQSGQAAYWSSDLPNDTALILDSSIGVTISRESRFSIVRMQAFTRGVCGYVRLNPIVKNTSGIIAIEGIDKALDRELTRVQQMTVIPYVDLDRIGELRAISSPSFDLTKLIRLCEEINICYTNECYLATAMLVRALVDHIPPVFGYKTFVEVANNYGGKSLKKSLQNLQNSSRNIADAHLHLPVRSKESLPNKTQVNFSNDLDVLLAEIVRILK